MRLTDPMPPVRKTFRTPAVSLANFYQRASSHMERVGEFAKNPSLQKKWACLQTREKTQSLTATHPWFSARTSLQDLYTGGARRLPRLPCRRSPRKSLVAPLQCRQLLGPGRKLLPDHCLVRRLAGPDRRRLRHRVQIYVQQLRARRARWYADLATATAAVTRMTGRRSRGLKPVVHRNDERPNVPFFIPLFLNAAGACSETRAAPWTCSPWPTADTRASRMSRTARRPNAHQYAKFKEGLA